MRTETTNLKISCDICGTTSDKPGYGFEIEYPRDRDVTIFAPDFLMLEMHSNNPFYKDAKADVCLHCMHQFIGNIIDNRDNQ